MISASYWQLGDVVDLQRYPLGRPESRAYQDVVEAVRQALDTESCAVLSNFVRADRIDRLQAEAETLRPHAVYMKHEHNPYFSEVPDDAPPNDPRRYEGGRTNGMVRADQFDRECDLWQLYKNEALLRFLADCLGIDRIYCYEDPYGCLILSVQQCGEEFTWHFDTMEYAVTMLIQEPLKGGLFEYAPNIRTPEDECYPEVAEVLANRSARTRALEIKPGDLQLFRGRYSIHRVTRVEGDIPRMIAVLGYTSIPGVYATPERSLQAWGEIHPDQIEAQQNRSRADSLTD